MPEFGKIAPFHWRTNYFSYSPLEPGTVVTVSAGGQYYWPPLNSPCAAGLTHSRLVTFGCGDSLVLCHRIILTLFCTIIINHPLVRERQPIR